MGVLSAEYEPDLFGEFMRPEEQHNLEHLCRMLCERSELFEKVTINLSFFYEEESFTGIVLNWTNIQIMLNSTEVGLPCWMILDNHTMYDLAKRKILNIIHTYPDYIAVAGYAIGNEYHPSFMDPRPNHPYEIMNFPYYISRKQ